MRVRTILLISSCLAALCLGACGGDDNSDGPEERDAGGDDGGDRGDDGGHRGDGGDDGGADESDAGEGDDEGGDAGSSESYCITDASKLDYTPSYHNFDDRLNVETGERTYLWRQQRDRSEAPTGFTLSASGSSPLDTINLTLLRCRVLNDDSDCGGLYGGSLSPGEG